MTTANAGEGPPAPQYPYQARLEVEEISKKLATTSTEHLVYNITGAPSTGKSRSIKALTATAEQSGWKAVPLNLTQFPSLYPSHYQALYEGMLRPIAAHYGVTLPTVEAVGKATVRHAVDSLLKAYAAATDKPDLLLTIDLTADEPVDDTLDLLLDFEALFLSRLADTGPRPYRLAVLVASVSPIPWQFIWRSANQVVPLSPFSIEQTRAQLKDELGDDEAMADRLHEITGGWPGANASLWQTYRDKGPEAAQAEFDQVYVAPYLSEQPNHARVRAVGVLGYLSPDGFDLNALRTTLAMLEPGDRPGDDYAILRQLVSSKLVSVTVEGRYLVEPHLAKVLYHWNERNHLLEVAKLQVALAAPTVTNTARNGQTAKPQDPPTEELSFSNYDQLYQRIIEKLEGDGDPQFVGRKQALRTLAAYLCRQPGYDANFLFIQARAGTGKSALLRKFLDLVREAAGKSDLLIVPSLRDRDGKFSDEENIIELETTSTARLSNVRRQIRSIIKQYFENLGNEAGFKQAFDQFDKEEKEWQDKRNEFAARHENGGGPITEDELPDVLEEARKKARAIEDAFYTACLNVSRLLEGLRDQKTTPRRIMLVFDTFDYPVRSNPSATLIFAEIMRRLQGQLFCLIAGRPPIKREEETIKGDLTAYLPDNLRDVAEVIDLDDDRYALTREDIVHYYERRVWYNLLEDVDVDAAKELVEQMAKVMSDPASPSRRLPVLLNLLEIYAGQGKGRSGELSRLGSAEAIIATTRRLEKLAAMPSYEFKRLLIEALLEYIERIGSPSHSGEWAMLFMSTLDRGVYPRMLRLMTSPPTPRHQTDSPEVQVIGDEKLEAEIQADRTVSESIAKLKDTLAGTNPEDIINAILMIAFQDALNSATNADDVQLPYAVGTTLVKSVRIHGQRAYKLHDYVSEMFNQYISDWAKDEKEPSLVWYKEADIRRETLLLALNGYLHLEGEKQLSDYKNRKNDEESKPAIIRSYQDIRASQIYYGFKLAALRLVQNPHAVYKAPCDRSDFPAKFDADHFVSCIAEVEHPLTTAQLVMRYLWGKMIRTLTRYPEFGFGETLLDEVSYFRYNQNVAPLIDEVGTAKDAANVPSLTIPLDSGDYSDVLVTYYAALTLWQRATGHYAIDEPWAAERRQWHGEFRPWRGEHWVEVAILMRNTRDERNKPAIANGIMKGIDLSSPNQAAVQLDWQRLNWSADHLYYRHADASAELLIASGLISLEQFNNLLISCAVFITNNPDIGEEKGLLRAIELLDDVKSDDPFTVARVHYRKGFIYRVMGKLEWATKEEDWGARWHYRETIILLKSIQSEHSTLNDEQQLLMANAYNGWSYVLALTADISTAKVLWGEGNRIITNLIKLIDYPEGLQNNSLAKAVGDLERVTTHTFASQSGKVSLEQSATKLFEGLEQIITGISKNGLKEHIIELRKALGRSYSTLGEIHRLGTRLLEAHVKEMADVESGYKQAIAIYKGALSLLEDDPDWIMIIGQQIAFTYYRMLQLKGGHRTNHDAYEWILHVLESASDSADPARRLDAYRRACVVLMEMAQYDNVVKDTKDDDKRKVDRTPRAYEKLMWYYAKGLELALHIYDSYNATRMTIEAIEATIGRRSTNEAKRVAEAEELYRSAIDGSVIKKTYESVSRTERDTHILDVYKLRNPSQKKIYDIMGPQSRFRNVLKSFAELNIGIAKIGEQKTGEQEAPLEAQVYIVNALEGLRADLVEEQMDLTIKLEQLSEFIKGHLLDENITAILGKLQKLYTYIEEQSKLLKVVEDHIYEITPVPSSSEA